MPKLGEWKPGDPVQLLVYGKSKTGKTAGALTFPRPVVFDFDHGIATARSPWFVQRYGYRPDIFYEEFYEKKINKGIVTQHNAYDDACRFFDEWMKPEGKWTGSDGKTYDVGLDKFDTFVIDSGTTLSEFASHKALIVMGMTKLSKSHEMSLSTGLVSPKVQDHGAERSLTEQFVDMILSSNKNVVLLAHEKVLSDDEGNVVEIAPLLTGQSIERVPLKFDEVYNLRVSRRGTETLRLLQTEADGLRKVGTRYGIPNNSEWNWETISGQLKKIHEAQLAQAVQPSTQEK